MRKLSICSFFICCFLVARISISQNSVFSTGSDFNAQSYQVHVVIGEPFSSFVIPAPTVQEGVLAVLMEMVLVHALSNDAEVQIFPNPFIDQIDIRFSSNNWSLMEAEIYSMSGELIQSFRIPHSHIKVPLASLKNGTYFIRFHGHGQREFVYKILKL